MSVRADVEMRFDLQIEERDVDRDLDGARLVRGKRHFDIAPYGKVHPKTAGRNDDLADQLVAVRLGFGALCDRDG